MIFVISALEYAASFMTCSEIEATGVKFSSRTALLEDALRVAEEDALSSLENIK
jgi:hypothetical protein